MIDERLDRSVSKVIGECSMRVVPLAPAVRLVVEALDLQVPFLAQASP